MKKQIWIVGDNMPGYMPDSEPFEADNWQHAKECLLETLQRDLENTEEQSEGDADLKDCIEALESLPADQEFGYTANSRYYWISLEVQ